MAGHHILKVGKIINHGESGEGRLVGVHVADEKEREFVLLVPHQMAGELAARLRAGASFAAAKRGEGPAEGQDFPLKLTPSHVRLGQRTDGSIAFRIEMPGGMLADVGLPASALAPLREAIDQAIARAGSAGEAGAGDAADAEPEAPDDATRH